MKAKNILAGLLVASICLPAFGQKPEMPQRATVEAREDSVIIRKGQGNLRIRIYEEQVNNEDETPQEVEIYEGIYLEKEESQPNAFLDALPFIPQKKRKNSYEPHNSGLYIGFTRMTDQFLGFGGSKHFPQDLSQSWEFGFNFLSVYHNFKKNPHWGLNIGTSWGYRSFNIDGNVALVKENGRSVFSVGDENTRYSHSRLRHFFFRIPITLEWQQRLSRHRLIFFNFGPEFEIRHGVKSFSHINGSKKKRVGKGMYVNPVGVSLLAQAGYGNLGFYLRYNTYSFFQKDKGPDVMPCSFGIAWYW